jgi:phospholipid/cholesterol/gamma-HCH transport system ATP-binding protein
MAELLTFTDITLEGVDIPISFSLKEGEITVILTAKEDINAELTRVMLGFSTPESGKVSVAGKELSEFTKKESYDLRKNIGVVLSSGGLISNLKVWENLILPLLYHTSLSREEIESRGVAALERVGYKGKLFELVGHLTLFQKRMLGFARAMLSEPDLIVYESPMQGLNLQERNRLLQTALAFHEEKPGRTSLFLTSSQEAPAMLKNANIFSFIKGQTEC